MNEDRIITGCQKGDEKAQEMLYKAFADKFYRVGFRYLQTEADAEDIVIVAFGKIFKAFSTFRNQGPGSLEAWMRKIVVNEALMQLRKRHNFNLTELLEANLPSPDMKDFSEASAEDIYKMITTLPAGYRTVFNLSVVEGYSHQEIASMLAITAATSRSQLFKAKSLLRKMLNREGFQYGT